MKTLDELAQISRVRTARAKLEENVAAAKSKVAGAECTLRAAQQNLTDAQGDLAFHQHELDTFNQRYPTE